MKQHIFIILFVILFLNLISCSTDKQLSKEQLLKQSIIELENRFEERSLSQILEYVSKDYHDERGRGLRDIKRAIQLQLMRHKTLYVFSTINDIQWSDDNNARVMISAAMAGKPIESTSLLKSIRADLIKFTVDFIREDGVFKVKSATWTWATPTDFVL